MIPDIIIFAAMGEHPPSMAYAAAFVPDKRPGTHWQSTGPTPEAARAKLEAMWRREHPEPKGAKKKPETVDDEIVL